MELGGIYCTNEVDLKCVCFAVIAAPMGFGFKSSVNFVPMGGSDVAGEMFSVVWCDWDNRGLTNSSATHERFLLSDSTALTLYRRF